MFIPNNLVTSPEIKDVQDAIDSLVAKAAELGIIKGEPKPEPYICHLDIDMPAVHSMEPRHSTKRRADVASLLVVAEEKLRSQRAREKFLPSTMLRDLGWNILLDLFVHDLLDKRVSVSSACLSSGGPATTALRWLQVLEKEGLLARSPDPHDRRKVYVSVTDEARNGISRWLRYTP